MQPRLRARLLTFAALSAIALPLPALAQVVTVSNGDVVNVGTRTGSTITGFSGFTQNGAAVINPGQTAVTLTPNTNDLAGSAFITAAQTVIDPVGFRVNFTYTAGGDRAADGATFTIHNDPAGATALGEQGGGLGYTGINNSASFQMNIFDGSPGGVGSVFNVNGLTSQRGGLPNLLSLNFASGNPIAVSLDYHDGFFMQTLRDTVTGEVFAHGQAIPVGTLLGGTSARFGFTGATGGFPAIQTISNLAFTFGPSDDATLTYEHLTIDDGGTVAGPGNLQADEITMAGGALAVNGLVSFDTFTQTSGNVAISRIELADGQSYTMFGGTASINLIEQDIFNFGGAFILSGGVLDAGEINVFPGTFVWLAGTFRHLDDDAFDASVLSETLDLTLGNGKHLHLGKTDLFANITVDGGSFTTGSIEGNGQLFLRRGQFNLTAQDFEISDFSQVGAVLFVGPQLTINIAQLTHIDEDARLVVAGGGFSGGEFVSHAIINDGTVTIIDGHFGVFDASENNGLFDAIRSFITFGGDEEHEMLNRATVNLIDSIVFGRLHITEFGLLRTAGGVTFAGDLTSDAPIAIGGTVQFLGTHNNVTALNGNGTVNLMQGAALVSDAVTLSTLQVAGTHTFRPGAAASKVSNLILEQDSSNGYIGVIDLDTRALIVQASSTADKEQKIDALTDALLAGKSGSTWTGNGITSGTAADNSQNYAVGLFNNAVLNKTSFGGQSVNENSLILSIARYGDTNLDGIIDINDLGNLANHWQQSGDTWDEGDFNMDGFVDINDLGILASNWQQVSAFPLQSTQEIGSIPLNLAVAIPEPASLSLIALAIPLCLSRRRSPRRLSSNGKIAVSPSVI